MSSSEENLAIGDWVVLTKKGAKAHRKHHNNRVLAVGAVVGAAALPLALPGGFLASVGMASAGVGVAVTGTAQAAVGAAGGAGVFSVIKSYWENHPEAESIGIITDKKKRRGLGQKGYDYNVVWSRETVLGESSWHLGMHLVHTEPPLASAA